MTLLAADRAEIGRFVHALFCHADADGYVSLRTFEHQPGAKPVEIRAVQLNGEGLEPVVAQATGAANRAARYAQPCVFSPPGLHFPISDQGRRARPRERAMPCDRVRRAPEPGRRTT